MLLEHIGQKCHTLRGTIRFLTLPGSKAIFESDINAALAYKRLYFDMLEQDPKVAKLAKAQIAHDHIPGKLFQCADVEFLNSCTKALYDVVWMDWCGQWRKDRVDVIRKLVCDNFLNFRKKSPPLLGITLAEGRELNISELHTLTRSHIGCYKGPKLRYMSRVGGIPCYLNSVVRECGFSLRPDMVVRYRDAARNNRARTMLTFLFSVFNKPYQFDVWDVDVISMIQDQAEHLAEIPTSRRVRR